jgi:hypothetical protein
LYSFPYLWVHFPASLFSCPPQPSPASSFPPLPSSPIRSRGVGQHEVTSACMAHHEYVSSDGPVRKQQCFANKDTDLPREKRVTVRGKHKHTHTHTHTHTRCPPAAPLNTGRQGALKASYPSQRAPHPEGHA